MNKKWIVFIFALLAGGLVGFALSGPCRFVGGGFHPGRGEGRMMRHFTRRLDLTADQRTQVEAVLKAKRAQIEALMAETHPKFEALRVSGRDEIRRLLTPEQQKKFDDMEARRESRMKKQSFPPPPPAP